MEKAMIAEEKAEVEAARTKEAEAKVKVEKQRTKLIMFSSVLVVFTLGLGLIATTIEGQKRESEASRISAYIANAEILLKNHNQLEAAIASIEALGEMKKLNRENQEDLKRIQSVIDNVQERNRLEGHEGSVYSVAYSPDGEMIASAGDDGKIILWNPKTGMIGQPIPAHQGPIWSVRFSPDGKFFASGGKDKTVKLWSSSGEPLYTFKEPQDIISDVSFSANSKQIAAGTNDGDIIIWDVNTHKLIKTLKTSQPLINNKKQRIYGLDFSPKEQSLLVYANSDSYFIWDLKNNSLKQIDHNQRYPMSVRFSKDGTMIISCGNEEIITIWKKNGELIRELTKKNASFIYVDFSYNNQYIAALTTDGRILLAKLESILTKNNQVSQNNKKAVYEIQEFNEIQENQGVIYKIAFNPNRAKDNFFVSGGDSKSLTIWEITNNNNIEKSNVNNLNSLLDKSCNLMREYNKYTKNEIYLNFCETHS
jgi:WD40 repeat protein